MLPVNKKTAAKESEKLSEKKPDEVVAGQAVVNSAEGTQMENKEEPVQEKKQETPASKDAKPPETEEVDIDLTDPEVKKAAIFIQSGFKGLKNRKKISSGIVKQVPACRSSSVECFTFEFGRFFHFFEFHLLCSGYLHAVI